MSSCTHCAAESARWSYWPGRYSMAKNLVAHWNRVDLVVDLVYIGLGKIVVRAAANSSGLRPETS